MASWVEEKHEIMSNKGFFEQVMSEKQSSFQKLKKLIVITPTSIPIQRYTGCFSDWSIPNNDQRIQKFDLLILIRLQPSRQKDVANTS